jgi:hypothetical protein
MKQLILLTIVLLISNVQYSLGQQAANTSASKATPVEVDKIIKAFSSKETEFREALNQYSFKRDAVIQEIGMGGQVAGEYHRVSVFVFDDKGNRFEKITFFPQPTLQSLVITAEDLDDMSGVQPFALEASKIHLYNFTYAGKERIDELDLYVFDVAPKVVPDYKKTKDRFFQGKIWVDDKDFQIVKAKGKGVPEGKQRFPTFETYREHIDGRYWFPTYTYTDEELVFQNGVTAHVRARIRYTDFKKAQSKLRIIDDGEIISEPENKPEPTKKN